MSWITPLYLTLFLLIKDSKPVEEFRLDILRNGTSVGELKASKTTDGERTTYLSLTNIKIRILAVIQVNYRTQVTFKNGELESSKVDITLNGKPYGTSSTKRLGNIYQFYKDGKLKSTITGAIKYSSALLVYGEPKGFIAAYSEESGTFQSIEKQGTDVYEKVNSRGRKTIYHYQNQALNSLKLDAGIAEFEMVLKD